MSGNHPLFSRRHPGQSIPADYLNGITDSLARLGRFGDQVNGLATSAGVYRRLSDEGNRLRTFELDELLLRSGFAAAKRIVWDGEEWVEQGEEATLYGEFFRGVGFAGDRVQAIYHPVSARWFAIGSGHTMVRGKLNGPIGDGGIASLRIEHWNETLDEWAEPDPPVHINVWDAIGLDEEIEEDAVVLATWHEQGQIWIATGAACPEED